MPWGGHIYIKSHRENKENFHMKPGQKTCIGALTINNMTFWEFFLLFFSFFFFPPHFLDAPVAAITKEGATHTTICD